MVSVQSDISDLKRDALTVKTQSEFNSANLDNLQYQIESQLQIMSSVQDLEGALTQKSRNLDQLISELKAKEAEKEHILSKKDELFQEKLVKMQSDL